MDSMKRLTKAVEQSVEKQSRGISRDSRDIKEVIQI